MLNGTVWPYNNVCVSYGVSDEDECRGWTVTRAWLMILVGESMRNWSVSVFYSWVWERMGPF